MKSVGIITFHCADNFGAVLQAYALTKVVEDTNKYAEIIDFKPEALTKRYDNKIRFSEELKENKPCMAIKRYLLKIKNLKTVNKRIMNFKEFRENYFRLSTNLYFTPDNLKTSPPLYDYYITGSDQVWNPDYFQKIGNSYFLDFAPQNSIKISYAASIANKSAENYEKHYQSEVKRFNFVSVREKSAKNFISKFTEKEVNVVVDPTLLLSMSDWKSISTYNFTTKDFILVYDLIHDPIITEIANELARKNGCGIISYSKRNKKNKYYDNWIGSFASYNPTDFVGLFEKSKFVITSSFHGTAFAILFNKPFYTAVHPDRGSRIIDLLKELGLEDRIINEDNKLSHFTRINYELVNKKLDTMRNNSLKFIKKALGE